MVPIFTSSQSISPGENPTSSHCGIATQADEIHVVWEQSGGVRYMKSTDEGQNWSSPTTIGGSTDEIPLTKCIALDGLNVYVLYAIDSRSGSAPVQLKMVRSTNGGSSFGSEVTLDNGADWADDRFLRVSMVAQDGNVHIVYSTEDSTTHVGGPLYYLRSTNAGSSFETRTTIGTGTGTTRPDLAVFGDTLHAVWTDDRNGSSLNGGDVYYNRSEDAGDNWAATDTKLSNTAFHSTLRPTVAVEGQNVICVWQYLGDGDPDVLYCQTSGDGGDNWSTQVLVASGTGPQEHPTLACQAGVTMLVYTNWDTTPNSTYAMVSLDYGTTWGASTQAYAPGSDSAAPLVVMSERFGCVADRQNATDGFRMVRSPVFELDPAADLLDDFNRASLGSSWTTPGVLNANTGLTIVSSAELTRESSGSYRQGGYYNASQFANLDEIIEMSAVGATGGDGLGMYARLVSPGGSGADGYGVLVGFDGTDWEWTITTVTDASTPVGMTGLLPALAVGDQLALTCRGNLIMFWRKPSGGAWTQVGVVVDDSYSSGYVGMEFLNNQDTRITNLYASENDARANLAWVKAL